LAHKNFLATFTFSYLLLGSNSISSNQQRAWGSNSISEAPHSGMPRPGQHQSLIDALARLHRLQAVMLRSRTHPSHGVPRAIASNAKETASHDGVQLAATYLRADRLAIGDCGPPARLPPPDFWPRRLVHQQILGSSRPYGICTTADPQSRFQLHERNVSRRHDISPDDSSVAAQGMRLDRFSTLLRRVRDTQRGLPHWRVRTSKRSMSGGPLGPPAWIEGALSSISRCGGSAIRDGLFEGRGQPAPRRVTHEPDARHVPAGRTVRPAKPGNRSPRATRSDPSRCETMVMPWSPMCR